EDLCVRFFLSSQLINEVLNGSIRFVIGDFDFGRGRGTGCWSVMKQAIGQGSADALVEEDEQGAHTGSLFGEAVGVVLAHSLQQAVAFHFAQVVAELIENRKSTRLNSSHDQISYAVFCLKKKN